MLKRFPAAFRSGLHAVTSHYQAVAQGAMPERPFPANPYPRPADLRNDDSEWHAWNAGWNEGLRGVRSPFSEAG